MTDRTADTRTTAGGASSGGGNGVQQVHGYGMGRDGRQGAAASVPHPAQYAAGQQGQAVQPGQPQSYVPMPPQYYAQPGAQGQPGAAAQMPQMAAQVAPPGQYAYGYPALGQQYVPPATSIPQEPEKKRRKRGLLFWLLVILAVVAVVAAVLFVFLFFGGGGKSARQGTMGQLKGKTPEEIQAELDRVVEDGMFNISIASTVQFPSGTAPGELRIENVPGNRYLMRVVITENGTGQQIYETDLIEPNFHIQSDTLDVDLSAGTYDCTAMFYAYDPDTEDLIGQAAAEMAVIVES